MRLLYPRRCSGAVSLVFGVTVVALVTGWARAQDTPTFNVRDDWASSLAASKSAFAGQPVELARAAAAAFPMQTDWLLQDSDETLGAYLALQPGDDGATAPWMSHVLEALPADLSAAFIAELSALRQAHPQADDPAYLRLYERACRVRRATRLAAMHQASPRVVYVRRHPVSPSFFAYTEGQSDAQAERHFRPGSELCLLTLNADGSCRSDVLLDSPEGVIRDPDVSYDGERVLFAWKKADLTDDYHLYELPAAGGPPRQITFGLGVADFEPAYLPTGEIVFSSSRCVQTVDCWWTEVSNLYLCDARGHYLRRVGFDQVHTVSPHVLNDGTVIYTRWDYNDRGQIWPQGLFQMNPDGTGQREFYGNSSYFPTTIAHARGIPGTGKVLAVAMGHHTWQAGKLIAIDPARGRQEADGVTMLAPRRVADPVRVDAYGQDGELFRHPHPLTVDSFLVSYVPAALNVGRASVFGLFWMAADGRREVLAEPGQLSCNRPVPLVPRVMPHMRPSSVDYRETAGTFYVQDVYLGPGLQGIPRGTIKALRVVALDYRAAGVGSNGNGGPAGGALVSTPIAINNGAWDVKRVLGCATVYADGSAFFETPARTPLYFQALDGNGDVAQTMRSWATLQPGETQSCIGCHESKNETPPSGRSVSMAMNTGPEQLTPFYGPARGFSFIKEIQPILDRHCVQCHGGGTDAVDVTPSSSHCGDSDTDEAMCDGHLPANSDDHAIRRHTWWSRRGGSEWAQLQFDTPQTVGACQLYWFDDRPRGGTCRVPANWRLLVQTGDQWQEVADARGYGVERDRLNTVTFTPVVTEALRVEVNLREGFSGGILEWLWAADEEGLAERPMPRLDLTGKQTPGPGGRAWSASYLALTQSGKSNEWVNWINAQSVPSLLPPYTAGAAKSRLLTQLRAGHKKVVLSREELDKLACWIDLLVPYCGDYTEANAWSETEREKYAHFQRKRERQARLEGRHIEALIAAQTGRPWAWLQGRTNLALNPFAGGSSDTGSVRVETNSVCRGEACFAATNLVDGRTENQGHGPEFPSWGPDHRDDVWVKIDLGAPARVKRIDLWIRADFPHDSYWKSAVLEFSDGSEIAVDMAKTAARQVIEFPERTVSWVRFSRLVPADPGGWCGFSEVEVWGERLTPKQVDKQ